MERLDWLCKNFQVPSMNEAAFIYFIVFAKLINGPRPRKPDCCMQTKSRRSYCTSAQSDQWLRMTVDIILWTISTKVWERARIKLATPETAVRLTTNCAKGPDLCLGVSNKLDPDQHRQRTNVLSVPSWVQTVCKGYQQTANFCC